MFLRFILYIGVMVLFSSCCKHDIKNTSGIIANDTIQGVAFADTIIYDVIIKNTDPNDFWTEECLRNVNRDIFIDNLFQNIYNGELEAFHFLTEEKFEISTIKSIERGAEYSRESIGKIQFAEIWHYDANMQVFDKKVLSVILGIEQFDQEGKLKGYKPLFKVYLN